MIQSMTGFGKSVLQLPNKKITIEIKSLNSKNLDLNARIPSQYREKELVMRNTISSALKRGKVDFSLYVEQTGDETSASVNAEAVKNYIKQLKDLDLGGIASNHDSKLLEIAMRLPDALKTERDEIDENEFAEIEKILLEALAEINEFRTAEGAALEKDLKLRVSNIGNLLDEIMQINPERVENVRERLRKGIEDLKENVDENRFEQELVYYIEKYDITEEKVRLANHLKYFESTLNSDDSNGKKLGFIS